MKHILHIFSFCVLCLSLLCGNVAAGELKAFVEPFTVTGIENQDFSVALQTLLASRLSGDGIVVVDSPAKADLQVKGSYLELGKVFSIDVTARNREGEVIARTFEQGGEREQLLAAMTKVGEKLSILLVPSGQKRAEAATPPVTSPALPSSQAVPGPADVIRQGGKTSQVPAAARLTGVYAGLSPLQPKSGERQIVVIKGRAFEILNNAPKPERLAEATLESDEKILAVDTVDLDGDGQAEIYLTVMRDNDLNSQVWIYKDKTLVRVADRLPYFFRAITGADGKRILYAQQTGKSEDYYGPVYELIKGGNGYELRNPLKLPKNANVFNFNRFVDSEGISKIVVLNPDGFLIVYNEAGIELWRSDDKYGGSETYFTKNDQQNIQFTGAAFRKIFLEQRITISKTGEIIVPRNAGFWTIGNSRSYSKNTLHGMVWNGAVLEERWRTRDNQAYLADYFLDEPAKELVLLEVVKKEGVVEKGATALSTRKVD